jgi:hypothetical protein
MAKYKHEILVAASLQKTSVRALNLNSNHHNGAANELTLYSLLLLTFLFVTIKLSTSMAIPLECYLASSETSYAYGS